MCSTVDATYCKLTTYSKFVTHVYISVDTLILSRLFHDFDFPDFPAFFAISQDNLGEH